MKKKPITKPASTAVIKRGAGYSALVNAISGIDTQLVTRIATVANQALVLRNWLVGAYIVKFEQQGADRARYGARLLEKLARDLASKSVKGLDERTLRDCRTFFSLYPQIRGPLDPELSALEAAREIRVTRVKKSPHPIRGPLDPELPTPLAAADLITFSWAHFLQLIRIDNPWKRAFYENELLRGHWSKRQLQRQIESLLYERTGLSTNKKAVVQRARKQDPQESIADLLRDPYILEFTGLAEHPEYSEDQLESALLDHVQRFLLELGTGVCFEARQFRMTEGRRHHRVDLVFYHRILRCHLLIELKIRAFQPADAGQMNFYVNWFKTHMMAKGDNPPVGILLCSDKDGAEVEFATAGMDQKLFVARYLTQLPSAQQLKAFLERDRTEIKLVPPASPSRKK